jgi:CRP/FNR family transcriptional regulator, cyclic AMP receptor protein
MRGVRPGVLTAAGCERTPGRCERQTQAGDVTMFGATQLMQIKQFGSFADTRRIASGTTMFVKGAPGTVLFAVVSGTMKIAVTSIDGREATFNLLHAGDIFGEIAVLDGQPRTANAIAVTDCELMVIQHGDFLRFVHGEPDVAMMLIELLCTRLRVAGIRMEEAAFLNLSARLARLLLRLLEENAAAADRNNLSITQQEISGLLGTTRGASTSTFKFGPGAG